MPARLHLRTGGQRLTEPHDRGLQSAAQLGRRVGDRVFPIARKHVHGTVLVAEDAILNAQKVLWESLRIVAEPGGVAAFSAICSGAYKPMPGERVAAVISGGNTTAVKFER